MSGVSGFRTVERPETFFAKCFRADRRIYSNSGGPRQLSKPRFSLERFCVSALGFSDFVERYGVE